jgi:ABC-type glycerol-3-phosphate transport system permease component
MTHRAADNARLLPRPLHAALTALLLLLVAAPVGYMLLASANTDLSVVAGDFWPRAFTPDNYARIWSTVALGRGLANSVAVAGAVAAASALVGLCGAYALVGRAFRGRATILRALVGLQSVPGTLLLLPVFVLFATLANKLGVQLIGTRGALFVTYLTFALPFSTWVMVTYLRGLPAEIIEAGYVDGATAAQVLRRIVLPLSWPGLVVAAIFAFLLGWNDVLFASVMTDNDTRTAAVALQVFGATQEGGAVPVYGQMMAAAIVCAIPVVALYLVFQRYLISGLAAGGVK